MRQALAIPRQGSGVRLQRFLDNTDIGAANHGWHLASTKFSMTDATIA